MKRVEQRLEQHKVPEHSLPQRNEILQEEVDKFMCFLVIELETALHSFNKDGESDTLGKEKSKPNHVHELVAFFNSKGTG